MNKIFFHEQSPLYEVQKVYKFKQPRISYMIDKTLLPSVRCGSKEEETFKKE